MKFQADQRKHSEMMNALTMGFIRKWDGLFPMNNSLSIYLVYHDLNIVILSKAKDLMRFFGYAKSDLASPQNDRSVKLVYNTKYVKKNYLSLGFINIININTWFSLYKFFPKKSFSNSRDENWEYSKNS